MTSIQDIQNYLTRQDLLEPKLQEFCKILIDQLEASNQIGAVSYHRAAIAEQKLKDILELPDKWHDAGFRFCAIDCAVQLKAILENK